MKESGNIDSNHRETVNRQASAGASVEGKTAAKNRSATLEIRENEA